jgi:molybdenum cofactor cytidylyltransferase
MGISALYLAAGLSRRMGVHKQSLELAKNKPLAGEGLLALLSSPIKSIMVVVHPEDPLDWFPLECQYNSNTRLAGAAAVQVVRSLDTARGIAYSIRCGIQALIDHDSSLDAVLVVLADQPFVTTSMFAERIQYWLEHSELDYVATASHEASGGSLVLMPPAVLSRSMFAALMLLEGDQGARKWFQSHEFKGEGLTVSDGLTLMDIDTVSDMDIARETYVNLAIAISRKNR